jgi:ABC-type multidrug transport system fused ATPase/permease subunit
MLNESLNGIKDIVVNGREKYFQMRFAQVALDLSNLKRNFMTLLGIPRLYLELLAVVGLVALNLTAVVLGRSSESLLPMLALFAGGAFRLMPAANRVAFAFQSLKMGRPIVDAMQLDFKSSSELSARVESDVSVEFRNQIRFEGVSYSYPNSNKFVIDQMSFEIEKGSEVGILGTTGAGKSTLVDILLGLLRPTRGRVTVDGVDISTNIRGWQALVGYVPQTIFLIDSSIRANIAFGIDERDIDDERIMRTLVLAQLNEFVDGLPAGINELVGERGVRLSGGQRQRIGIARALYLDPPILVFDEATSALDLETEKEVMKSIDYLRNEKTIVIVTHRFSALEHCDQTIRVDEGKPTFKQ